MFNFLDNNTSIKHIRETNKGGNIIKELIRAIVAFICTSFVQIVPEIIIIILMTVIYGFIIGDIAAVANDKTFDLYSLIPTLVCQGIGISYIFHWAKKRDEFSIKKEFFAKEHWCKKYLIGMGVGFLLMLLVTLIGLITKQYTFIGIFNGENHILIILFFIGFLFQGAFEEVFCRGYLLPIIARKHSTIIAIIVSSLFFSALHVFNGGFTLLSCVNIFLYGVFMAIYMLKYNDLWGACAIHSIWNFAQGCIFGFNVSGALSLPSIFTFEMSGVEFWAGGSFGPEGGFIATIVLTMATLIMLKLPAKE